MFDGEDLVALRHVGDPIADEVVHAQVSDSSPLEARDILVGLTNTLRGLDDSPLVAAWVNRIEGAPSWVDATVVAQGQQVFREWSLDIVTSLFCASLPFAYAAAQGVEVLERVSQLARTRRLLPDGSPRPGRCSSTSANPEASLPGVAGTTRSGRSGFCMRSSGPG